MVGVVVRQCSEQRLVTVARGAALVIALVELRGAEPVSPPARHQSAEIALLVVPRIDRFEAGVATTLDVLDAQLAEMQAELDRTRVLADIRLAEARLARVVGR